MSSVELTIQSIMKDKELNILHDIPKRMWLKLLTQGQLLSLENNLLELKSELTTTEKETDLKSSARDSVGELSMYANHPGDLGTELFEREKDFALNVHANAELAKVENALEAITNGTYGKCKECNEDIPYERLEAVPYTTVCKYHAIDNKVARDRPVEEGVLRPAARPNSFVKVHEGSVRDYEDSFKEAAESGTSETPSDFTGDHDDYETLYTDGVGDGTNEEYESFTGVDINGSDAFVIESPEATEYKERLDDVGLESMLGDIPYHEKDSYLED